MPIRQATRPRPVMPVPDAVERVFLLSARAVLRAAWGVADVPDPHGQGPASVGAHPKMAALEAIQAVDYALKAAFCADGGDAVIGHAMVARSLAAKALGMRAAGLGFGPQGGPHGVVALEGE